MPDDLADDLQSMSFGSSTVSSASGSSSSSASGPLTKSHAAGDPCLDAIRRLRLRSGTKDGSLSLSDLRFLQRLGSGDIGSVYLAELKCALAEGCMLAAKVMDRKELEGRNKEGRARTEREILEITDHPFLPTLYAVAENDRWSCLLTEFCPGGDLHVLRQRQPGRRFSESAVRFYASEVVVALEYIHMMGIVYRDLKPENVLVRSDGHIMLTDFDLSLKCDDPTAPTPAHVISDPTSLPSLAATADFAPSCILPSCIVPAVSCFRSHPNRRATRRKKRLGNNRGAAGFDLEFVAEPVDLRSMSFVGTHEYLSPEIVSGEGHGSTVDWWTLGVFIFELLYGVTPFKGSDNELTLANIVARALEFPKDPPVSSAAKDLIAGLLVKDPLRRLGSTVGATAVKRHPFFNGVNWALLRCATPPYIPPPFKYNSSRDLSSDDSCPGTPVEYY
ncbi:serine/threonine-protein kinase D6PKL1-like [Typha latifolia]|uniref:serine/threonine-protein kinase D6PKL1-like n=1 Tax=Typha latifolia TaxID=4733 RepID=UPI003C2EB4CF